MTTNATSAAASVAMANVHTIANEAEHDELYPHIGQPKPIVHQAIAMLK